MKGPVKLFILRPTMGQGGADRVTLTLLRTLDRTRFAISLVLAQKRGVWLDDIPADVRIHSLDASSLWTAWFPLSRLLAREKPDILFSTSSGSNIAAVIASRLSRQQGALVLSERNVLFHGGPTLKRRVVVLLKRFLYRYASQITSVSVGVKEDLMTLLRIPSEKISVIYNPIVTDEIKAMSEQPVEHPWFQQDIPIILGVGRMVPEKDFFTLIRAFSLVREKQPARLVILGEGPLKQNLIEFARGLNVLEDMWLPGFVKNPFQYMAKCAVFVLSSNAEGFPGVLVQAMACGASVISTDCHAGPSEVIRQNEDGILVPVGDASAIAEKIFYLLEHPEIRHSFGAKARESSYKFKAETVVQEQIAALLGLNNSRSTI